MRIVGRCKNDKVLTQKWKLHDELLKFAEDKVRGLIKCEDIFIFMILHNNETENCDV